MRRSTEETQQCPKCGGQLLRVRRHRLDRVISTFYPVHRFHCLKCHWAGRMRAPDDRHRGDSERASGH
ncbi:MAG TPA: hypothetical protein VFC24_07400 [Casimicrobiaceae bacterium]|nr:hypothetical protein [Casimicrobiaceae bacterium]